jgi:NTP pyrophosphatase (non-canonical NTP hydrolase)
MHRDCPKENKVDIHALMAGLEEELAELRTEVESEELDYRGFGYSSLIDSEPS